MATTVKLAPPEEDMVLRLCALDVPWVVVPPIQRVLLFDDAGGQLPPFPFLVGSLRASLTATLARFPPLAGRVVFLPSTGDAAIDCSASYSGGGGVRFVVAEMDDADARKLAADADHDVDAFRAFTPELQTDALPAEVLAVRVTRLKGGVAVGVAVHHAVADGRSLWRFLEAWAGACRGDDAVLVAAPPTFDLPDVALPAGGEELVRSTLRKYAPHLPLANPQFARNPINMPRRTFTLAAQLIHRLKQRIVNLTTSVPSVQPTMAAPSSFVAITALTWVSFVRSKHPVTISDADDVYLLFFFDCRGRRGIDPQVSDNYFGTCITGFLVKATASELLAEDGVAVAAAALQGEVRRAAENPVSGWNWLDLFSWLPQDRLVNVSGSTRFPAYEVADFGWGAPSRTELVSVNNGQVVLIAAKGGCGGVQASVCMHPDHMDAFNAHFLNCLVD
ncbi:anthocyanin 5-aromatic acyltransferase [Aegilops tauschii subsp. strangulata]|nr:anthocyanin 5-aromatic acyltransferase [Aegilops tauschii subsp. strangulata]